MAADCHVGEGGDASQPPFKSRTDAGFFGPFNGEIDHVSEKVPTDLGKLVQEAVDDVQPFVELRGDTSRGPAVE